MWLTCSILVPCMACNGINTKAVHVWHRNSCWITVLICPATMQHFHTHQKNAKESLSWTTWTHMVAMISVSLACSQTATYAVTPHVWNKYIHVTLCTSLLPSFRWYSFCLPMDGWPGYMQRWFNHLQTVTNPANNRAWCRATTLTKTNTLPLSQTGRQGRSVTYLLSSLSTHYIGWISDNSSCE